MGPNSISIPSRAQNFRMTGLKFGNSEKMNRLEAKLKMLDKSKGRRLPSSSSSTSLGGTSLEGKLPVPIAMRSDRESFVPMPMQQPSQNSPW